LGHGLSQPTGIPALPQSFFARPAEVVAPELIGCLLVKRQADGNLLWAVIVETEAYSQEEPACHGYRRRTPGNETLFGDPGHWYVYLTYGIHHCVNVVTHRAEWANGVLLRAAALPGEHERLAAGPARLARRFGLDRSHDGQPVHPKGGLWIAPRPPALAVPPPPPGADLSHRYQPGPGAALALVSPGQPQRESAGQGGSPARASAAACRGLAL
jgi:DNA-3-methyladenine glycosylase